MHVLYRPEKSLPPKGTSDAFSITLLRDEVAELVISGGFFPEFHVRQTDTVERIVVESCTGIRKIQIEGILVACL